MVAAHRIVALIVAVLPLAAQAVKVRLADKGIVRVNLEEYVGWVLAGEAGGMKSDEALKAMAVVIRTYARANQTRHLAQGFNYCETTHCQDARVGAVTTRLRSAVDATEGVILWSNGRPATVFYTGHCGGRTAAASEIWPTARRAYLPSQEDTYCLSAGRNPWTAKLAWTDLSRILGLPGLQEMEVQSRTASGRALSLRTNRGLVSAERLHLLVGRDMGWNFMRSRNYEVEPAEKYAIFRGFGTGHGVGLCQIGAEQRGKAGFKWDQILQAYFPGTRAGISAQDIQWQVLRGERVDVWSAGAPGDETLPLKADKALAEAERLTGLKVAKRVVVRVYPNVSTYRDTTGESGKTAAVTRGRVIHMQPRTADALRHEMIHVVLGLNSRTPLALWLDEGLADYLTGGSTYPAERAKVDALVRKNSLQWVLDDREQIK
ncbi:SpoIID/LytB domain-containing protein [uncultured Paludibaculum sp.]|uniref:SpoIID/LytB domain-containing protein n=1 Tax=uncultured Paludibaculum sp. TaxID=1765020 RepID=UPI002AAB1095|nr:SpoIID/LytB domain-containing protein [uncultured Paludibaculum sp.]